MPSIWRTLSVSVYEVVPLTLIRYLVSSSTVSETTEADMPPPMELIVEAMVVMDWVERSINFAVPPIVTLVLPGGLPSPNNVPTAVAESLKRSLFIPLLVGVLREVPDAMNPIVCRTFADEPSKMLIPAAPVSSLARTRW